MFVENGQQCELLSDFVFTQKWIYLYRFIQA